MTFRQLFAAFAVAGTAAATASAQGTRLLRHPTVGRDAVVFAYAGDLWTTGRNGGQARRLTSTPTAETGPRLSPDGSKVAVQEAMKLLDQGTLRRTPRPAPIDRTKRP